MKVIVLFLLFLLSLTGCRDEYYELDKDPLKGKIEGEDWAFGSGWVEYDPIFTQGLSGMLLGEQLQDPCTRVRTTDPHLSISVPYSRGNYNLPFSEINFYVVFSVDGVKEYTANSGFIEIVSVTSFEIVGYISADFDDNNNARGSFSLRLCD